MADKFVDFSATNDGDGTAFGQAASPGGVGAYNTLVGKTFAASDKVWIRRKTKTQTALTFNTLNVIYIGWPVSGDIYFATRPAAAQATWDPDAATYAEIDGLAATTPLVTVSTNSGQELHRLKIVTLSGTGTSTITFQSSVSTIVYNSWIENASTSIVAGVLTAISNTIKFDNCTLLHSGTGGTGFLINTAVGTYETEFINCVITGSSSMSTGRVLIFNNTATNYLIGCTITCSSTTMTGDMIVSANSASVIFMNDCTVDSDSTGNQVQIDVGAGVAGSNARLVAFNLTMNKGRTIFLTGSNYVHFRRFNQSTSGGTPPTYAIQASAPGTIVCGSNFTFQPGNTQGDIQVGNGIYYFLQNCTFASSTPMGPTPTDFPGVWVADDSSAVGFWKYRGQKGDTSSNSVSRTGGETFSLKFELSSGSAPFWKHMMPILPAFETIWVSLPASVSTITIYGAYKNYGADPPTQKDIWIETDYLDAGSGAHRAFSSSRQVNTTVLVADGSTWVGDTGLTIFKMTLTMTPGQACLAPIRLYHTKRVATAFVYIDPKPVVT